MADPACGNLASWVETFQELWVGHCLPVTGQPGTTGQRVAGAWQ
uniref:Uncharacterized protein n=1 Tax=Trichinella nativa TaxID=6335 RepID=A0A0V1JY23_9BILA